MKPWDNQKGLPLEIEKSPFLYLPRIRYMRIVDDGLEIASYCHPAQERTLETIVLDNVRPQTHRLICPLWMSYFDTAVMDWLYEHDISLTMISRDWHSVDVIVPRHAKSNQVFLKRKQFLLTWDEGGRVLASRLMEKKLRAQGHVLDKVGFLEASKRVKEIALTVKKIGQMTSLPADLLAWEGQASTVYWNALKDIPVVWTQKGKSLPSERFITVGERQGMKGNGRYAITPCHSMLNYLVGMTIGRLRIEVVGYGLDTDAGFYHVDDEYRESLLWDLIEPIRPLLEERLIDECTKGLAVKDFLYERTTGRVRLDMTMRLRLVDTYDTWIGQKAHEMLLWYKKELMRERE